MGSLEAFIRPKSLAVVGASTSGNKAGGRRWLSSVNAGFSGALEPINRTATEMNGHRVYRSLRDIPGPVDLVAVLVPPGDVMDCIRDCAAMKVGAVVVISAGFGEVDERGKAAECQMRDILGSAGVRMIGPNSAGVFSGRGGVNLLGRPLPEGPIAIVTQSGNMAGTFAQQARAKGLGFASLIAIGNAGDVSIAEAIDLLQDDCDAKAILVYCEGFAAGEGRYLVERMRARKDAKPVVILKPGLTEAGRRSALSHTGAIAGEEAVIAAALRQYGIIRALESEEAWDAAAALATCWPLAGRNIAIVSDGGGHATIVADCTARYGLDVPEVGAETRRKLEAVLPARSSTKNPVDFAGFAESDPDCVGEVVRICLEDPDIHGVIFAGHFGGYFKMTNDAATQDKVSGLERQSAQQIAGYPRVFKKPVIVHTEYAGEQLWTLEPLRAAQIPVVPTLEAPPKMMAALYTYGRHQQAPDAREQRLAPADGMATAAAILASRPADSGGFLLEPEARAVASAYGVPTSRFRVVAGRDELAAAATAFNGPVAMKLIAPQALHKSDVGGVLLGLDPKNLGAAFETLARRAHEIGAASPRFILTEMIAGGVECIVGARRDVQFGPAVVFGLGGIFVEALQSAVVRLAPIGRKAALAMIEELPASRVLKGSRGRRPVDLESLASCITRVSELIDELDFVEEVDINPLFALEGATIAADCRIILRTLSDGESKGILHAGRPTKEV